MVHGDLECVCGMVSCFDVTMSFERLGAVVDMGECMWPHGYRKAEPETMLRVMLIRALEIQSFSCWGR